MFRNDNFGIIEDKIHGNQLDYSSNVFVQEQVPKLASSACLSAFSLSSTSHAEVHLFSCN
jgi:hypothetical protein